MTRRRRTTEDERLTPCACCGYPLAQRHHALPVATFGDNEVSTPLCANCHELVHLIEEAGYAADGVIVRSKRAVRLFEAVRAALGAEDGRITWLTAYVGDARRARLEAHVHSNAGYDYGAAEEGPAHGE